MSTTSHLKITFDHKKYTDALNPVRPKQNDRKYTDDMFKGIFWIPYFDLYSTEDYS